MRTFLALVLAAGLAACGPGSSNPSPPPDGGGTGDGAGGGSGGGGGSQPSGGSDQPSGGGDQPSGGSDQPSGGSGQPSGGDQPSGGSGGTPSGGDGSGGGSGGGGAAGPVKSPDGTVTLERSDASAECDGLVPATAPSAVTASDPVGGHCFPGISEGGGHVAAGIDRRHYQTTWRMFSPQGAPGRTLVVADFLQAMLLPQPDGWVAGTLLAGSGGGPTISIDVVGLLPDGTPRGGGTRVTPNDGVTLTTTLVEDPRGGAAFVWTWKPLREDGCVAGVARFDASGTLRAPQATFPGHAASCTARAAVSRAGETFVIEEAGDAAWLHWIAADGAPATAPARAGAFVASLAPLLDGSIVARQGAAWTLRFPHLADHAEAAPGWLASRPGYTFRNTRGERGYALLPPAADSPDCTQRIEIVAPSGRLCGTVTLSYPGGPCRTIGVDQGWDGTVVQQVPGTHCTWRWWPRLLGG